MTAMQLLTIFPSSAALVWRVVFLQGSLKTARSSRSIFYKYR